MTTLVLAFYAEGRTDERFLPIVIQRTVEQILAQRGRMAVDVLEPVVLNHTIDRKFQKREERILEAARRSAGYHALIVHADADHPTPNQAMDERIRPGFERVYKAKERVCDKLLPIIPVQMTEAWMLIDSEALRSVIGTNIEAQALGLPTRAQQVESDRDPKQTLIQAIQNAIADRPRRRRRINLGTVYEPLARLINLERLSAVPAYQQFVSDMTETLIALHLAQ
jgi:hypothetical protein